MSRIGKQHIALNSKTNAIISSDTITVEGPKGKLQYKIPDQIQIKNTDGVLTVTTKNKNIESRKLHGLSRTLVSNMVTGVSEGFCKILKIEGVGYRAQADSDQDLILNIGYSHPIYMTAPTGVTVEVKNSTEVRIKGISKEKVGQFAAQVRSKRPPEPYKGKGIRYDSEIIRKKAGKAGK